MDLAARFGGEAFVIALPSTNIDGAMNIAERVRESVRALQLRHEYSQLPDKFITISVGVSEINLANECTIKTLIRCADKTLYKAKAAGRNICIADRSNLSSA